MGSAVLLGGLVVLSLVVLAAALVGSRTGATGRKVNYRRAAPLAIAGMLLVGCLLGLVAHASTLVVVGLTVYTGVAVAAMWRLIQLDRGSRWMEQGRRRFRIGISIVAMAWLGIVLGLFLSIAASIASGAYGP
jgi:hypothetical protein